MRHDIEYLYSYEFEALLNAIRRDIQAEEERIQTDPEWADIHRQNVRMNRRLIRILDPGQYKYKPEDGKPRLILAYVKNAASSEPES